MRRGAPERIQIAGRHAQFTAQYAVQNVYDALVELITNSDDSYRRMHQRGERESDGGPTLIELERRRSQPSIVRVCDRAEGMTLSEMRAKLGRLGERTSERGDRGFMARGAKDCVMLGQVTFESIKSDQYHRCELTRKLEFVPYEPSAKATPDLRRRLGIPRGTGTVVTLEIERGGLPLFGTLLRDLPRHFALRDILAETSPTEARLRDLNDPAGKAERLVCRLPAGELVAQDEFSPPDYPDAQATLVIWRAPEPFEDPEGPFRRHGLLVKGHRAIHECSLLDREFEADAYARRYFGRIDCPHVDVLCEEYDARLEAGLPHPEDNPSLVIDPNRKGGLRRDHPFTRALLQLPSERLRALLARERDAQKAERRRVADEETQRCLDRLARAAGRFLKQQLEETQEIGRGEGVDPDTFTRKGVLIVPTYVRVAPQQTRVLYVYASGALAVSSAPRMRIRADHRALSVLDPAIELHEHPRREAALFGRFRIRGEDAGHTVAIQAEGDGGWAEPPPVAEALAEVAAPGVEEHEFDQPLEFERGSYRVRENARRTLRLFARYPEVVSSESTAEVRSTDPASLAIRGRCVVLPVAGSNFAMGEVVVEGRRLVRGAVTVTAALHGRTAQAEVRVVQREETGLPLRIELRDEPFGDFRARWADHEGQPNVLLVSTRHKSVRRYLGPNHEGQHAPHFRLLLAEIVAESVCRKSLALESRERPWDFEWSSETENYHIADSVFWQLHRRMRDFVAEAHAIMLPEADIPPVAP